MCGSLQLSKVVICFQAWWSCWNAPLVLLQHWTFSSFEVIYVWPTVVGHSPTNFFKLQLTVRRQTHNIVELLSVQLERHHQPCLGRSQCHEIAQKRNNFYTLKLESETVAAPIIGSVVFKLHKYLEWFPAMLLDSRRVQNGSRVQEPWVIVTGSLALQSILYVYIF